MGAVGGQISRARWFHYHQAADADCSGTYLPGAPEGKSLGVERGAGGPKDISAECLVVARVIGGQEPISLQTIYAELRRKTTRG